MTKLKDGRFEGDLYAELTYDPIEKSAFRVRVWTWGWVSTRDTDNKPGEKLAWRQARGRNSIWREPEWETNFKYLDKAVSHLFAVRAQAETRHLSRRLRAAGESRRELLA